MNVIGERFISFEESRAAVLAETIRAYWINLGFFTVKADAWPIPGAASQSEVGNMILWGVRSNLVGGLPPGATGEQVVDAIRAKRMAREMQRWGAFSG
jgi:hypothetical protein